MVPRSNQPGHIKQLGIGHKLTPDRSEHDGGCERTANTLSHYALKTHRSGHEAKADEGNGVGPSWGYAVGGYASFAGLPDCDRGGHGEESLDHSSFFINRWLLSGLNGRR